MYFFEITTISLLPLERQGLGQFLPLALGGYLDGVACALAQDVDRVVLAREGGREVFAAKVVDELQRGFVVVFHLTGGDDPAEGVVFLAQKAGEVAVEFLSGDDDVLIVEINAQVDVVFVII